MSDAGGRRPVYGIPTPPEAKTFLLRGGKTAVAPARQNDRGDAPVAPTAPWPGAPLRPDWQPVCRRRRPGLLCQP
ncbi:MAG: hypothetical protein MZV49_17360 [Rhodopseudomonas palustris]|nr:hypothetical protein [Rhodopseudomonas palustris]